MKKFLTSYLSWAFLLLAIQFNTLTARASHIVGMDLYYQHVTGTANDYKIYVVAFGDCGPASATAFATLPTSSPTICIYDGNTYVTSISLTIQPPDTGVEITPVCPGVATQCSSTTSTIPGIKKFIY